MAGRSQSSRVVDAEDQTNATGGRRMTTATKLLKMFQALAQNERGIGVRELAREIGIDKSAVSRLFDQLCEEGFAQRDSVSGQFVVGPALFALAATVHARDTLWEAAEPILRSVAEDFNETCYLAVRDGDEIVFRDKIDCTHTVRYVIDAGVRAPMHAGAGGRAILIGLPDEEIVAILGRTGLPAMSEATITDIDELMAQVRQDRGRGYAMSMGERVSGGSAIAAPYFGADGTCLGSLVFTQPSERFKVRLVPQIAERIAAASDRLSRRLGYAE